MTIAVDAVVPSIALEDGTEDLHPEKDNIVVTENSVTNQVVENVEQSVPVDPDPANEHEIDLGNCTPKSSPNDYPQAFYCHRTNVLMKDPEVGPDGESIERSATDDSSNKSPYYPNRALKAIVQEATVWNDDSLRSSWMQFQHSVSHSLSQIFPDAASEGIFRPLNDAFYCPITFNIMHHPVIDPEGYTFERVAVENWIRINGNSPITRAKLSIDQLYGNKAIARLLQDEKEKPEHQMHPSIRKWKDERAPLPTDVEVGVGALLEQQRRQRGEPTTLVFIASSNGRGPFLTYPMTPREWNDLHRELGRRLTLFTMFAMLFAGSCLVAFIIVAFVNFGGTLYLMLFAMALLVVLSKRRQ
jgi:hypothetical protein